MLSQDKLERDRYQARLKFKQDHISSIEEAEKMGYEKGLQEGYQEGMKEAALHHFHVWQRLLGLPLTPKEELAALSLEALQEKIKAFEQQFGGDEP